MILSVLNVMMKKITNVLCKIAIVVYQKMPKYDIAIYITVGLQFTALKYKYINAISVQIINVPLKVAITLQPKLTENVLNIK